jgi:hypothetical protein
MPAATRRVGLAAIVGVAASCGVAAMPAWAGEACPDNTEDIETDRPDVTNSSLVVPLGSLQAENGINWTTGRTDALDGTNTRLRLGVAHCTEVLVDLPDYTRGVQGPGRAGFSDIAPAIKRQIEALPEGTSLSGVVGLALPTGAVHISGSGYGPYLQAPWSQEIADGWSVHGMLTVFWFPNEPSGGATGEVTLSIERELSARSDVFFEHIGDYRAPGMSTQLLNMGGAYRLTKNQQIDFHLGVGLNDNSPHYFVGLGYSFRFDGLF